jgi:hypothetical protein
MTHCSGHCQACTAKRMEARAKRTAELEAELKDKDYQFWETRIGEGLPVIGWCPPEPWKFPGGTR